MASMICQNFQSSLECRALGLQVAASNLPLFLCDARSPQVSEFDSGFEEPQNYRNIVSNNNNNDNNIVDSNLGSWSSIESLTKEMDEKNNERLYVHPLAKRSSSALSEKSLELCTESLGCETGTDVSDDINFSTSSMSNIDDDSWRRSSPPRKRSNFQQISMHDKVNRHRSFPPPLTTITNCDSVQFRPHREGGRLIIKAIAIEASTTYFQAERGNGRLRLVLKEQFEEHKQEENEVEVEVEAQEQEENELEVQEEGEDEDEDEDNTHDANLGDQEIFGNRQGENESELGIGKFQRPSRCYEHGNKEFSNWEHFWVAT